MQISVDTFRGKLQRWRQHLRALTGQFDADFKAAGTDRQYELWACAMVPECVSLAALMALAEDARPQRQDEPDQHTLPR